MLQDYTGTAFVPAFWSLGAEEKFYLLAPLLALGVTRLGSRAGQAAALSALWMAPMAVRAAMAWGASFPVSYEAYFPVFRSPFHVTSESLVLGFSVAWASRHLELVRLSRAWREGLFWTGSVALGAATTTVVLLGDIGPLTVVGVPAAVGLAFAALVVAAIAGRGSYTAALAWRGWRPLATGAFTLYLTHMMVIPVASAVALDAVARGGPLLQQWMRFVPWYLALSVASAWLLHIGVERPVLRWRDRWLSGRDGVGAREDGTIDSSPDDSGRLAVRA
jgi:peptidoglycan/LPS O-acetylase OafA/YrhL